MIIGVLIPLASKAQTRARTLPHFDCGKVHPCGRLPNFDKRNNIPISKQECEFDGTCAYGFAQRIHYLCFSRKSSVSSLFLQAFLSGRIARKIGIWLRKRTKKAERCSASVRAGTEMALGRGCSHENGSLKVSVEKSQGES